MAGMVKRADFLENEVVDLTEEIKLVSPTAGLYIAGVMGMRFMISSDIATVRNTLTAR